MQEDVISVSLLHGARRVIHQGTCVYKMVPITTGKNSDINIRIQEALVKKGNDPLT